MRLFCICLILLALSSCFKKQENTDLTFSKVDTLKIETKISFDLKNKPNKNLIRFCKGLKAIGLEPDTVRARKLVAYPFLKKAKIKTFEGIPFFKLEYPNSSIGTKVSGQSISGKGVNFDFFEKQKSIWAYFYREKRQGNSIPDGIIEQWEFESEKDVKEALTILEQVYPLPFFNTNPYYKQEDNYLIIFHTRAMAYSYNQEKLFHLFNK